MIEEEKNESQSIQNIISEPKIIKEDENQELPLHKTDIKSRLRLKIEELNINLKKTQNLNQGHLLE